MSESKHDGSRQHKKKKPKQKPVLEKVPAPQQQQQAEDGNTRFARALGSTDYGTREKGLQALSRFLVHKDAMPELDMLKLWKGLYFCFWHSDKVPVQTELAERLAGLLQQLKPSMAQLYWAGLLATLRREWFAMDHHRIDKFLMLVRKFVAALMKRLQAAQWDADAISSLTGQMPFEQTLIPVGSCKSLGLSYHLSDVWLSELKNVAPEQAVPQAALQLLLEPFVKVLEGSGEQALLARIKEAVFDALVADLSAAAAGDGEQHDWKYCSQLNAAQIASQLFERGAAEGIKARNRQVLYSISKELERTTNKRRKLKEQAAAEAAAAAAVDAPQPVFEKKAQKNKHREQLEPVAEPQQQQEPQQHEARSAKKGKHKMQEQAEQQQEQRSQQQEQPAVNGVTPKSSKKHKKMAEQQQAVAAAVTPVSAAAAPAAEAVAALTPVRKSGKKKRKHSEAGEAATPAAALPAVTPKTASAAADRLAAEPLSTAKKGVKIDLRKNVYFAHGAPVPPEDIRTPPTTKPKGSALKASSKVSKTRTSPATAPAKQQQGSRLPGGQGGTARKPVTPKSVPRVKAAAFF